MSYGNVPPPPAPGFVPPPRSAPPAPGWFRRNLKWFIPTAILCFVLLIVAFIGGVMALALGAMKSNEPYQHAVRVATQDPRALARMGAPVQPGWWLSGNINVTGSSGNADFAIPVEGTAHKGTVYVVAKKSAGRWTYQTLELQVEDAPERLDLLRPSGAAPEEK